MKRRTLLGLGMLALVLGLSACGSKEKSSAGEVKQEADSGKDGLKVNEDYFLWYDDQIDSLTMEGRKQKKIVIPAKAKKLNAGLFGVTGCEVEEVYFESDEDIDLQNAFSIPSKLKKVVLPKKLTDIGEFKSSKDLESIVIPEGVTSLTNLAFENCVNLKEIKFAGNNLKDIGKSAFENCENLKEISLPNSVENIGVNAFKGCTSLTEIHLPSSLKTIEGGAFTTKNLTKVYAPGDLELTKADPAAFPIIPKPTLYAVKDSWMDKNFHSEMILPLFGEIEYYEEK